MKNIPNNWKSLKLKSLITQGVKNGYSPNCPEEPNGSWILSLGNLAENGFDATQAKPAPKDDKRVDDFLLKPGDFLISRSNTLDKVGRTILFRGEIKNCSYPDLLMRFRVDETQIANEYLEGYLRSSIVRRYIQECASGTSSSMVKINKKVVEKIPVLLPPLPEQHAVADILSTWNEAIEKMENIINKYENKLNGLYQYYFTPNKANNKYWGKTKISEILKQRNNQILPTENQPLYSLTIEKGITEKTDRYNREALVKDISNKKYKVVYPNDIVFNPANLRWGAISRSQISHRVVVSPIYEVLMVNNDKVDIDFISHLLTCPRQIGIYSTKTEGSLVERMAVKLDAFLLLDIQIPCDLKEQREISGVLNRAQKEIDLLKQLTENYKLQKRGLMQKLLTGEWRVKGV